MGGGLNSNLNSVAAQQEEIIFGNENNKSAKTSDADNAQALEIIEQALEDVEDEKAKDIFQSLFDLFKSDDTKAKKDKNAANSSTDSTNTGITVIENPQYKSIVEAAIKEDIPDDWTCIYEREAKPNENVIARNSENFYFDNFTPIDSTYESAPRDVQTITADGVEVSRQSTPHRIVITTNPEISEQEAAAGMVKKERENLPDRNGLIFNAAASPHKDIFTYEDGTVLENLYQGSGVTLTSQIEHSYSQGCDVNNPKDGDIYTKIERVYNEDGSYTEAKTVYKYNSKFGGWTNDLLYIPMYYTAYDADGTEYNAMTDKDKYMEIASRNKAN